MKSFINSKKNCMYKIVSIHTNCLLLLCFHKICPKIRVKQKFLNDYVNSKTEKNNMSSSFVWISILVSQSSQSLRSYLRSANIYNGNSNKQKSDLIEMIIYGCMNGKIKNTNFEDISNNKVSSNLKKKGVSIMATQN